MRNAFVAMSSFFSLFCLPAEDYPPMDIKTVYGQTFKDAQIVGVNHATVDITYLDSNNVPVMRGVKFKELTPELQAKFGYDPARAAENERREAIARQNRFDRLKQQDIDLWQKLSLQIQQRQSGQNVPVDINELYQVIYSGKSAITGFVVTFDPNGALVNVTGDNSETQNIPDNIIVLDLNAPARSNWSGYIYPTMMINAQHLPVYCVNPENAVGSVIATLKLDRDGTPDNTAMESTQASAPPATVAGSSGTDVPYSAGTYEYTTIYIQNGGGYYPAYPSGIWRWPTCMRPCPPKHGDCNGNWHNRHNGNNSDSKWVRRTDQNGDVKWINRSRQNDHGRNDQTSGNCSGSRWARRTAAENNGRLDSQISGNSKSDNSGRWIRASESDGKAWVRHDGQSDRGRRQPQSGNASASCNSYNNRGYSRRPNAVTAGSKTTSPAARARAAAPFTGSGFTGGTVGIGSWGGGVMSR